jgi:hypothetical protein
MIEIKTEMKSALEAQPARPLRYSVTVDGITVEWLPRCGIHCYLPGWLDMDQPTPADFHKLAALLNEIARTLEAAKEPA